MKKMNRNKTARKTDGKLKISTEGLLFAQETKPNEWRSTHKKHTPLQGDTHKFSGIYCIIVFTEPCDGDKDKPQVQSKR